MASPGLDFNRTLRRRLYLNLPFPLAAIRVYQASEQFRHLEEWDHEATICGGDVA